MFCLIVFPTAAVNIVIGGREGYTYLEEVLQGFNVKTNDIMETVPLLL